VHRAELSTERIGILLINSGTPQAADAGAVRAFLARFLADPRVVELPRALWLPLLYGVILPLRPGRIAHKYRRIWGAAGSPLRDLSERLRAELTAALARRLLAPLSVELGMLYSPPSVGEALGRLRASGAQRILVVPLYPQYCGATTGAVYDQVSEELRRWRWLPELRFVAEYHDHPGYIEALRASGELAKFRSVHFGTHGLSVFESLNQPLESRLLVENGALDAMDIANLRLNAELAVMSACHSGQRAIEMRNLGALPGDDIFGLQSAMFKSGVRSILGTLWLVETTSSSAITRAFHRHFAQGETAESALQKSVQEYIADASLPRGVYYWAPYFISSLGRRQ